MATATTTSSVSSAAAAASVSVAAAAASPSAALINTATVTGSCSSGSGGGGGGGGNGNGNGRGRGSSFRDICGPSVDPDDYPIFTMGQEEDEVSSAERKQPMMDDEANRKLGISEQSRTPSMLQSRRRLPAATSSSFSTRFLTNNATPLYSNVTAAATPISKAAKSTPAVVSLADLHDMISKDHYNKSHSSSGNLLKSWFSSLTRKTSGNSSSKSKNSSNNSSSDTKWQNLHNSTNNSGTITSNTTNAAAAADLRMMMMMEEDEWNLSLEGLKQKLLHASIKRDVALTEVRQLKSSMRGLEEKLKRLEFYCDTLKHALSRSLTDDHTHKMRTNHNHNHHQEEYNKMMRNLPHEQQFYPANFSNLKPLTLDAMVETFLESIAEARSAVRQLCRMFVVLLQEDASGRGLDKLNHVLQPFHLEYGSVPVESNKISRTALYHVEALFNQVLYQDFENCSFEKNGSQPILDPYAACTANFASFNSVRNLAWNEVLSKGSTKYFNESFSRFCDQKMALVVAMLGLNVNTAATNNNHNNNSNSRGYSNNNNNTCTWPWPWPEHVLHAFFVAAKTLWLLHLCAFSFHPPLSIFRVQCGCPFDPLYMDDMLADRSSNLNANNNNKGNINATTVTNLKSAAAAAAATVRIMVMPGFYIHNKVVKCKVLCRYDTTNNNN